MSRELMGARVCSYPGLIYVITVDILQLLYCNHRQTVDDSGDSDEIKTTELSTISRYLYLVLISLACICFNLDKDRFFF